MERPGSSGGAPVDDRSPARSKDRSRPRLVRWPSQAHLRSEAAALGVPCLLVVDPGTELPVVGPGEDWIADDADERDVATRLAALAGSRAPASPPTDRQLASRIPPGLTGDDARAARVLLTRAGRLVPRAELASDVASDADLDRMVKRVRAALASEGWTVHRVSSSGFIAQQAVAS